MVSYPNTEFFDTNSDDEVSSLTLEKISQAVVFSSDWTTETILSQLEKGNIFLNPSFQRRDAWTKSRKSKFIESLILGFPIPQIVLAENKKERGKYIVLDGKQRLLTIQQFFGHGEGKNNSFSLENLEILSIINGNNFHDLQRNSSFREFINSLSNQTIRTVVIRNWPNSEFLHTVFLRLNTESVPLSAQELRQALIPGDFMKFADEMASSSAGIKYLLRLDEPDFRMRDVELLVRYLAFMNYFPDYKGNMKQFLDDTCEKLNSDWAHYNPVIQKQIDVFENAFVSLRRIFTDDGVGRKWTEKGFEPRINRAILDVQLFYFSYLPICSASTDKKDDILQAFKLLCVNNEAFKTSIEQTTKSLGATNTRFSLWGKGLQEILKFDFPIPELNGTNFTFPGFPEVK